MVFKYFLPIYLQFYSISGFATLFSFKALASLTFRYH